MTQIKAKAKAIYPQITQITQIREDSPFTAEGAEGAEKRNPQIRGDDADWEAVESRESRVGDCKCKTSPRRHEAHEGGTRRGGLVRRGAQRNGI